MSGEYWGSRWVGGAKAPFLAWRWRDLFKRKPPAAWEYSAAADRLRNLSESPLACELLAKALEIEIDAGESVADWVSQAAREESLKAVAVNARMYADEAARKAGATP